MAKTIELKNVKVSFSTMLNKLDNKLYGRMFKVMVPIDSPELKETIAQYKELNIQAKKAYGEQLGKPLKNATSPDDVFAESIYKTGFVELKFNVIFIREKEIEQDGEKVKQLVEVLNPIYDTPAFVYKRDNNGKKVYELEGGKHWVPLSDNIINVRYTLVAGYNKKENKPSIQLKAEEVEIVESQVNSKSSGPKTGYLTLSSEDEVIEDKVEKATPVVEETMFSESELAELDV